MLIHKPSVCARDDERDVEVDWKRGSKEKSSSAAHDESDLRQLLIVNYYSWSGAPLVKQIKERRPTPCFSSPTPIRDHILSLFQVFQSHIQFTLSQAHLVIDSVESSSRCHRHHRVQTVSLFLTLMKSGTSIFAKISRVIAPEICQFLAIASSASHPDLSLPRFSPT